LNDAINVRLISESFIPVALNANRIPDDEGGRFFRKIMETNHWPQGIWVVDADGKVLAFHYLKNKSGETTAQLHKRWIVETREAIETGRTAFGGVQPRDLSRLRNYNPLPDRGVGVMADGGVRLAVSATAFRNGERDGEPAVDSVILSAKEWTTLIPTKLEAGMKWEVPAAVAARFAPALSPQTDLIYVPQSKDVLTANLTATVTGVSSGVAKIRYKGNWESLHSRDGVAKFPVRASASAEGVATCDASTGAPRSFLMVFRGTYRNVPPWDKPQPTGAVIEWKGK
jgi:hypothetical protein